MYVLYILGLRVCKQTRFCMEPPTSLSLLNSVLPCTLFNVEFAEQTRYCSISRTSLSVLKSLSPLAFLKIACPEVYIRVHFFPTYFRVCREKTSFIQNSLLINIPPVLGRSDDEFAWQTRCYVEPRTSLSVLEVVHPCTLFMLCRIFTKKGI